MLTLVRCIQYGFPLIGKLKQIKGLVSLAKKQHRQRILADRSKSIIQVLWNKKSKQIKEEDAAIMIQSLFRARKARQTVHATTAKKFDRELFASLNIKHILKKTISARCKLIQDKRAELEELQSIEENKLSDKQKLKLYELRDEVKKQARDMLNRKLLLRPNTRFAVYWKLFFVICLLWELVNAAVKPWLRHSKGTKSNKKLPSTLEELIARKLVPTSASELLQCQENMTKQKSTILPWFLVTSKATSVSNNVDRPWYCQTPYTVQELIIDVMALALQPTHLSELSSKCQMRHKSKHMKPNPKNATPWFCEYQLIHRIYRYAVDLFWDCIPVAVGMMYFLDVFVTFFTGDIHPDNGVLIPKPFVKRWIAPGLVLQLLVNPYMKEVSERVFDTMYILFDFGPVRVYRWIATVCVPIAYISVVWIIIPFWLNIVEYENKTKQTNHSVFLM